MAKLGGSQRMGPLGIFDSGLGGLTVLQQIRHRLPEIDLCYLGDNARVPYGNRSFETVYRFTREGVYTLLKQGAPLVVVACNTASAKALRSIQQKDLPLWQKEFNDGGPERRVLGVLRPTTEKAGEFTQSGSLGLLATRGTVESGSYTTEINQFFPEITLYSQACPLWVPLIEEGIHQGPVAEAIVRADLDELLAKAPGMDAVILGCTHYPLLAPLIRNLLPSNVRVFEQGPLVAQALSLYLQRHPDLNASLTRGGTIQYFTTEDPQRFDWQASRFGGQHVQSKHIELLEP